jgi:ketosteroid isomerase-like protein
VGQLSIRGAIERGDLATFGELLDPAVVWVGVHPGQLCRNREEVLATFRSAQEAGRRALPEILAEVDDKLVLDPHVEPPPELNPTLHQVLVVSDERIVEMRDYPNRAAALEAVGIA